MSELSFCEQCGSPRTPGTLFCEQCGVKFEIAIQTGSAQRKAAVNGLLVTSIGALSDSVGIPKTKLSAVINQYISLCIRHGVHYKLLDVGKNNVSCNQVLTCIESEIKQHAVDGILLLGDESIIPSDTVSNMTDDSDVDIPSDFAYSRLKTWTDDEHDINWGDLMPVGRLPAGTACRLDVFREYISTSALTRDFTSQNLFALTAKEWEGASSAVASDVGQSELYTSPDVTCDIATSVFSPDSFFYYFNVHGSDQTSKWYGQAAQDYPEAFEPIIFSHCIKPNIVATEACYGARFRGLAPEKSSVLSALMSNTLGFVGSSRIAFGPAEPPLGLADVIIGKFLMYVKQGQNLGNALNQARIDLISRANYLDPVMTKTLLEFALYGDPLIFFGSSSAKPKRANISSKCKLAVPVPDVLASVRYALDRQRQLIKEQINNSIYSRYPGLKGVEPKMRLWSIGGGGRKPDETLLSLTYSAVTKAPVKQVVTTYVKKTGEVISEYCSK